MEPHGSIRGPNKVHNPHPTLSRARARDKKQIVNFIGKSSSKQTRLTASQPKATAARRNGQKGTNENQEGFGDSELHFLCGYRHDLHIRVVPATQWRISGISQHHVLRCCRRLCRELAGADPTTSLDDRSHLDQSADLDHKPALLNRVHHA